VRPIQRWSFAQVLLVSLAWIVLTAGFMYVEMGAAVAQTGSGGIGAVSAGLVELILLLAIPVGPAVLVAVWLLLRHWSG
jgi:hypothetical protein